MGDPEEPGGAREQLERLAYGAEPLENLQPTKDPQYFPIRWTTLEAICKHRATDYRFGVKCLMPRSGCFGRICSRVGCPVVNLYV